MEEPNPLQEVRRHVPAKSLGIELPAGYHVLEARFRLVLCYGDREVRGYSIGADPKQIERDAARHATWQRLAHPEASRATARAAVDHITGLPWTTAISADAARLALEHDLHAVCIHLTGLDKLIELKGYRVSQTVLRDVAHTLKGLVADHDRLTRHSGDKLLVFTTRPLGDVEMLVETIHETVADRAEVTDAGPLPQTHIGVASLPRADDPAEAGALIEALVISAEAASTATEPQASDAPVLTPPVPEGSGAPPQAAHVDQPSADTSPAPSPSVVAVVEGPAAAANMSHLADRAALERSLERPMPLGPEPRLYASMQPLPSTPISIEPAPPSTAVRPQVPRLHAVEAPPLPTVEPERNAFKEAVVSNVEHAKRLVLKGVSLDLSGQVATALVELILGDRRVVGKTVGRDGEDRRLFLVAEAAARAVTDFLPRGYGVTVHHIQRAPAEVGKALWSVVFFLTPTGEQSLLGIAPADGDLVQAAANSVLNALNRRIGMLLSSGD